MDIYELMVFRVHRASRLVDLLEEERYVKRKPSKEDRRVVLVIITNKGLDVLAELDKPLLKLHKNQLGHLTRKELSELNRLL